MLTLTARVLTAEHVDGVEGAGDDLRGVVVPSLRAGAGVRPGVRARAGRRLAQGHVHGRRVEG